MRDNVKPSGKWTFGPDVANCFGDMLARSIPQLETVRDICHTAAKRFRKPHTDIVDLGASRGDAVAGLIHEYGDQNRYVLIECAPAMRALLQDRFDSLIKARVVDMPEIDLRTGFPSVAASVTLSVLTLQFVPIEYRLRVLRDVYSHTRTGGVFVLVEKVLGATADLDAMMVDRYYQMKRDNGYTQEDIDRKRLSLEGVLVPCAAEWNERMLETAGFSQVDCAWRWMNFAAWVAVK